MLYSSLFYQKNKFISLVTAQFYQLFSRCYIDTIKVVSSYFGAGTGVAIGDICFRMSKRTERLNECITLIGFRELEVVFEATRLFQAQEYKISILEEKRCTLDVYKTLMLATYSCISSRKYNQGSSISIKYPCPMGYHVCNISIHAESLLFLVSLLIMVQMI